MLLLLINPLGAWVWSETGYETKLAMAQKDVEMKDAAADEDHQSKEGDKQKESDEQQAKKDKDLLAFEGELPQL